MGDINKQLMLWENHTAESNIILNEHFCFIQIPKTASTTILNRCEQLNLVKKLPCYRHEGLLYIEQFINDNNLPVYAIVRNPFEHMHSYFYHVLRHKHYRLDKNLSIVENFEIFCKKRIDNVHIRQIDYLNSNKNLNIKFFKFGENKIINDFFLEKHNIDLKLENTYINNNPLKLKSPNIKSFFKNQKIVDLIIKKRFNEFESFNFSKNIDDLE